MIHAISLHITRMKEQLKGRFGVQFSTTGISNFSKGEIAIRIKNQLRWEEHKEV